MNREGPEKVSFPVLRIPVCLWLIDYSLQTLLRGNCGNPGSSPLFLDQSWEGGLWLLKVQLHGPPHSSGTHSSFLSLAPSLIVYFFLSRRAQLKCYLLRKASFDHLV